MRISELREWAAVTFGSHSHKEGQVLAALGPIEEWLGHLARQGINFEIVTAEQAGVLRGTSSLKPLHAIGEPPTPLNSGGVSPAGFDVPMGVPNDVAPNDAPLATYNPNTSDSVPVGYVSPEASNASAPEVPTLDTNTFVDDRGFTSPETGFGPNGPASEAPGGVSERGVNPQAAFGTVGTPVPGISSAPQPPMPQANPLRSSSPSSIPQESPSAGAVRSPVPGAAPNVPFDPTTGEPRAPSGGVVDPKSPYRTPLNFDNREPH